jgi:KaiC/GvpD/RAD55 family RecA-like ATPase
MHKYRLGIKQLEAAVGQVHGGTSILVAGPSVSGKRAIIRSMLVRGLEDGEGIILLPTMETGESVLSSFTSQKIDIGRLRIIDCMSRPLGMDIGETENIKPVNGPMDMTGIGVGAGRLVEEFRGKPVRLCIDSLSTLLMYSSLPTVFRFVHMLNGRMQAAGSLSIGVVETGMHDDRTMAALRQLYRAAVEVKERENSCFVRAIGLTPGPTSWQEV